MKQTEPMIPLAEMTDAMRAREVDERRHRVRSLQAHHLRPQVTGNLDVGQQVPLGLGVDPVGRLARRLHVHHEPVGAVAAGHAGGAAQQLGRPGW